ncbi:MAG TPA: methyltransferase domain-containing protein [Pirellulales bacterium]|nr:methyltransferase domain-containing protein [Pirellulales bacterium]
MNSKLLLRKSKKRPAEKRSKRNVINKIVEDDLIRRVSYEEYRDKVRDKYDGPQGAVLAACSLLSLHLTFGERLIRERKFDVRGARNILDVGSGAGQIAKHLLKYADPGARLTCFDLSVPMVRRARNRLKSNLPDYLVADVTRLPFADGTFDCVTCGYVIEHVPDARVGLAELARVMQPGGRLLLLASEDTFCGAWTSRLWCCRTYNRRELREACHDLGLVWKEELWFTRMHKALRAGGICVEIEKQ